MDPVTAWHLIDPQSHRRASCRARSHDEARARLWWSWHRRLQRGPVLMGARRLFFYECEIRQGKPIRRVGE